MRTLLIDNYDSFTYNLFQLLAEENGVEPIVVRNDEASWEELSERRFDNVVISPGPGRPERCRDFGVCAEAIRRCEAPLLGVCLGHQGLGWAHGGTVGPAPQPLHGRVRSVEHGGAPLFAGIPRRFEATRYHSLRLERPLPADLEEIAWGDDGVVMAIAHRERPQWGVQFHPESIATEHGRRLLANFRDLTGGRDVRPAVSRGELRTSTVHNSPREGVGRLRIRRVDWRGEPERAFASLFGGSGDAFWLDSSLRGDGRLSFMGDASGPLGAFVSYDVESREVRIERGGGGGAPRVEVRNESIFEYLERETARLPEASDLPFEFACGFAGYLGYEVKADCGSPNAHSSPHPDAAFVFAARVLAFDHEQNQVYLLCLHEPGGEEEADAWLEATATRLSTLSETEPPNPERLGARATGGGPVEPPRCRSADPSPVALTMARSRDRYLGDIATCEELLRAGESYEICLTNSIAAAVDTDPLSIYMDLRRVNPAPFASFLRFGDTAVLSSSPERFLRVDRDGRAEAKPIKGTVRRGETPTEDARLAAVLRASEKDRAENLMIVDLLRNDLGSICAAGSVEVPALMEIESYETVHQLVSTVRGRLRPGSGPLDCVRACFPPGSMTGAPKLRTVEILERLEGRARGVYSGAIGYFGAGGACDLSVAIRAIVVSGGGGDRGRPGEPASATIGAGGAIVLGSDPEREYEEMLLKAAAPLRAIDPGTDPASISLTDPRRAAVEPPPASAHDLTS
jgi:para-aminobenzoate synthetase